MQAALAVSVLAGGWAVAVVLTGGFVVELGGFRMPSRRAFNPAILALLSAVAAVALATANERRRARHGLMAHVRGERLADDGRRLALAAVAGAVMSVVSFGLANGLFVAAAADAYGYVSQADLWARGDVIVRQPWARDMTWPNADNALAPLGYRPHRPASHGTDIVPIYSPGVPILMAVFKIVGGPRAVYYVVPLLGGLAVWFTFLMGQRLAGPLVGASAALLLATSPSFLFEITAPASDVAVTSWWALAFLALTFDSRAAAFGAGLATGLAILTRPNLVPLVLVAAVPLMWPVISRWPAAEDRWRAVTRVLAFAAGSCPACLFIAGLNWQLYGSPLASGYGPLDRVFDWSYGWVNLARYPRWLLDTQTPIVLLAAATPFMLPRHGAAGRAPAPRIIAGTWLAGILALFGLYLFYEPFEDWWYLRFILPMFPPLFVLTSVALFQLTAPISRVTELGRGLVTSALVGGLVWHGLSVALDRGADRVWVAEQRYITAGTYVAATLPERAVLLSGLHSGSARFYSGRLTVRYDQLRPTDLELVLGELRRLGYQPYVLLDEAEESSFRDRFSKTSPLGALDWAPKAVLHQGLVRIYDPADRK
jgi:hypothetical protein